MSKRKKPTPPPEEASSSSDDSDGETLYTETESEEDSVEHESDLEFIASESDEEPPPPVTRKKIGRNEKLPVTKLCTQLQKRRHSNTENDTDRPRRKKTERSG